MKITKRVDGHIIELIIDPIEEYVNGNNSYWRCQVSKMVDGKKIPMYEECFSSLVMRDIENNQYQIDEDEEFGDDIDIDIDINLEDGELEELLSID